MLGDEEEEADVCRRGYDSCDIRMPPSSDSVFVHEFCAVISYVTSCVRMCISRNMLSAAYHVPCICHRYSVTDGHPHHSVSIYSIT